MVGKTVLPQCMERSNLMKDSILSIPPPLSQERVAGSRSSWVERLELTEGTCFWKTYVYPLPFGPLRGLFRNTFLAASRVEREARALTGLARAGLQPDLLVAKGESRRLGFLLRAEILTRSFGSTDLAQHLAQGPLHRRELDSLARFVRGLHESGLRDPDLKARNLLLAPQGPTWAKIDASSSWWRPPGSRFDRQRCRDLETLIVDLARLGMPAWQRRRLLVLQWFPGPRPKRRIPPLPDPIHS